MFLQCRLGQLGINAVVPILFLKEDQTALWNESRKKPTNNLGLRRSVVTRVVVTSNTKNPQSLGSSVDSHRLCPAS